MPGFYKMHPVDWNLGTDDLSLELEAAYLRICNAIYIAEQPIPNNPRVLGGLFRCSSGKAKRLLNELIEAEKVAVEGGKIINKRAMNELKTRRKRNVDEQSVASNSPTTGQQLTSDGQSAHSSCEKVPANPLKNNDPPEKPPACVYKEQSRAEQKRTEPPKPPDTGGAAGRVMEMGEKVLGLIGVSFTDPTWFGDFSQISAWLGDGLDFELDIFPAIQQSMAKKKPGWRPRNLKYFDRPVRDWYARRKPDSGLVDHFVANKGSAEWQAWREYRVNQGQGTKLMDAQESFVVPTQWPPSTPLTDTLKH